MPIVTSAVLSGSHSVGLVPDPHGSVSESGDIENLTTHVSRHYFVWVYCIRWKNSCLVRSVMPYLLTCTV